MNPVQRFASVILTAGLVVWIEGLITIEWTYPYCISPEDGPAYTAQGMPLPYWMWNGVVSLEHHFVPHIYALNILVLCLLLFPVVRWVFDRLISRESKRLRTVVGALGAFLLASHLAFTFFLISLGALRPTTSLSLGEYRRYSEFRPIRFGLYTSGGTICTPSRFWFPNGWQHN